MLVIDRRAVGLGWGQPAKMPIFSGSETAVAAGALSKLNLRMVRCRQHGEGPPHRVSLDPALEGSAFVTQDGFFLARFEQSMRFDALLPVLDGRFIL